jgi:hypothetical protein
MSGKKIQSFEEVLRGKKIIFNRGGNITLEDRAKIESGKALEYEFNNESFCYSLCLIYDVLAVEQHNKRVNFLTCDEADILIANTSGTDGFFPGTTSKDIFNRLAEYHLATLDLEKDRIYVLAKRLYDSLEKQYKNKI